MKIRSTILASLALLLLGSSSAMAQSAPEGKTTILKATDIKPTLFPEKVFFRYSASNLLVVDTTEIDFVERNQDLQELLRRLRQPVKGTQYFLPLGQG